MQIDYVPFPELLSEIVDNRGKTCPTAERGIALIATNCIRNDLLYPAYDKVRYVSPETYRTWFRGHPKPGDLIFVVKGTPGRVCMAPDPVDFCIAQDMVAVRADERKVYPKYLFALLRSPGVQTRIKQMHVGTLIPHFKKGDFDKLLLPMPDRTIQAFVGDFYFELSNKIDLNRRMNATLEAMARTIFKSWFVDFDPVRAKAEGRQPAGMPPSVAILFPKEFAHSSLGRIPLGWRALPIREVAAVERGLSYKGEFLGLEGRPLINLGCFQGEGRFSSENLKYYAGDFKEHHTVKAGDVVLANTDITQKRSVLGSPAIVPPGGGGGDGRYLFSHHVYALRFIKGHEQWRMFVYFALLQDDFRERAEGYATGTTVLALPIEAVLDYVIATPDEDILLAFSRLAEPILSMVQANLRQSRALAAIRDILVPKLLSGEVRVKDAEKLMGTAT